MARYVLDLREIDRAQVALVGGKGADVLTGGAAPNVAKLLGSNVRHEPHLVLSGIAVTARR